jgi:hypothetical protein
MKKSIKGLLIILLIVSLPLMIAAEEGENKRKRSNVRYFSKNSLFIYGLGATHNFDPPGDYYFELGLDQANTFAPVVGIGFRMLNWGNRFFLNLAFDFVPAEFDFFDAPDQKVNFYTIMLDVEFNLFRSTPMGFYLGMGVGFVTLRNLWVVYQGDMVRQSNETITTMAMEFGLKYPISRKMFLRGAVRLHGELVPSYDYWDEYDNNSDFDRLSTSLMFGIELHL